MERHQAGQKEALVEVKVDLNCLEAAHLPGGSPADCRGCFKCAVALATVMGLVIVALVAGFSLYFFMFKPSCNQDARPSSDTSSDTSNDTAIFNIICKQSKRRYDIFTANTPATYIIYGNMTHVNEEDTLIQTRNGRDMFIERDNKGKNFILEKVTLVTGTRISISFKSTCTESLFHVFKL